MGEPKNKRGRPKIPWDKFGYEVADRIAQGKACPTITEEAKYLEKWARTNLIFGADGKYLKWERIRDRIARRFDGAAGYKEKVREGLDKLLSKLPDQK